MNALEAGIELQRRAREAPGFIHRIRPSGCGYEVVSETRRGYIDRIRYQQTGRVRKRYSMMDTFLSVLARISLEKQ